MTPFLFLDNIEKIQENLSLVLNTAENIEMEHLLQKSKCSIFHNNLKYMIFQRCQKGLLSTKGLNMCFGCSKDIRNNFQRYITGLDKKMYLT